MSLLILKMWCIPAEEMDKKDEELRETIRKLWPIQAKKMLGLLVPPNEGTNRKQNTIA